MSSGSTYNRSYWHNRQSFKFENDDRWTEVDNYNWSKLHASGAQPPQELLERVLKSMEESSMPPIAVSSAQGKFLQIQARLMQARNILEVGMLGGYSTIWLASSHKDAKVTSIEIDPDAVKVAKKHFEWAGVSDRIDIKHGAAMDVFPGLVQAVKDGKLPKFDLVFIDANKENNLEYFNFALEITRPGSCIVIDNVVRRGGVVDPEQKSDPRIQGAIRAIEGVGANPRVDATILQTVGDKSYDGFLTAIVKE
jgi:predicted O-methyltransferase YrrM